MNDIKFYKIVNSALVKLKASSTNKAPTTQEDVEPFLGLDSKLRFKVQNAFENALKKGEKYKSGEPKHYINCITSLFISQLDCELKTKNTRKHAYKNLEQIEAMLAQEKAKKYKEKIEKRAPFVLVPVGVLAMLTGIGIGLIFAIFGPLGAPFEVTALICALMGLAVGFTLVGIVLYPCWLVDHYLDDCIHEFDPIINAIEEDPIQDNNELSSSNSKPIESLGEKCERVNAGFSNEEIPLKNNLRLTHVQSKNPAQFFSQPDSQIKPSDQPSKEKITLTARRSL